jgi:hypothetical protein
MVDSLESKAKTTLELMNKWVHQDSYVIGGNYLNQKWVPLEEAQKLEALNNGYEKIAFENSLKVDKANKILDEREKLTATRIDENGFFYKHEIRLTTTEKQLREVLK